MSTPLPTALYGRTSKDDPRRVTIEIQQQALRAWASRDALVECISDEFWDDGVSGKIALHERPEGRRLFSEVEAGRIKSVAVAYADRFGRTLLDGLQAVKALEDRGVKLVAINDGWDARRNDSPLYFQFRMMMAEEEHRRISQRMRDGKARAMDRDQAPPGGPLTFGYRMDGNGRFVPDPTEAAVVIRIFEMALAGSSNAEILRWVKGTGVPPGRKFQKRMAGSEPRVVSTHTAASWHLTKVGRILSNPVYTGIRTWGDRTFPCPPLVDRETFERVQLVVVGKVKRFGVGRFDPTKGVASGLFRCGGCGAPFYYQSRSGGVKMYVCDNTRRSRGCHAKMIRSEQLDADLWSVAEQFLEDPAALVKKLVAASRSLSGKANDYSRSESTYVAELERLDAAAKAVWDEQQENGWPMSWVAPRLNALKQEREAAVAALAEVRHELARVHVSQDESDEVAAHLATIRERLRRGVSPRDKYEVLRRLVRGGVIHTHGEGRSKTATIEVEFRWGQTLKDAVSSEKPKVRKLPKDWCYGNYGNGSLAVALY